MTQKEKTFLDQTAQRLHLMVDGESSILFGSVSGYQTMLGAVYNELKEYYELSLLDCFRMIPEMLRQEIIDSSTYIGELVKLYAFTLLGAIPTAISSMRSRKLKKVTYRLRSQRTNAAPEL